jgi:RND family efflux transporter MFP subunit
LSTVYRTNAAPAERSSSQAHAMKTARALPWMKKLAPYAAVLVVMLLAPVVGLRLARSATTPEAAPATTPAEPRKPSAVTASDSKDFVGVLLPPRMTNLAPKLDGTVLEVHAKLGQRVKKGDLLLVFDPRERKQALAAAKAAYAAARAQAGAAGAEAAAAHRRSARRNATVTVEGQVIPLVSGEEAAQSQFDAQGAGARAAAAGAQAAEQKVRIEQLEQALEETRVVAPFDGVVTGVYFEPNMLVHAGEATVRVVGGQGLRVRLAVPEESLAELRAQKKATLRIDDRVFAASLDDVAPEVEPSSRTYFVEGAVQRAEETCGGDCSFFAGRVVRASFAVQER